MIEENLYRIKEQEVDEYRIWMQEMNENRTNWIIFAEVCGKWEIDSNDVIIKEVKRKIRVNMDEDGIIRNV
jgi:hypothetical protein